MLQVELTIQEVSLLQKKATNSMRKFTAENGDTAAEMHQMLIRDEIIEAADASGVCERNPRHSNPNNPNL